MNRVTPRKSNHPIYPRPVSPLHYEPLYTRPEDVLWEESATSESDVEVRAAKRQRIEKLGEQYLRGDGLFIMTAGIRGPLGEGWKNPWKKRRKLGRGGLQDSVEGKARKEVPETVERVPNGTGRKEKSVVKEQFGTVQRELKLQAARLEENAKRLLDQNDPFAEDKTKSEGDLKPNGQDKSAWLKKNGTATTSNSDVYAEEVDELQRSPSKGPGHLHPIERDTSPASDHVQGPRYGSTIVSSEGRAEEAIKLLRRRETRTKVPITPQREDVVRVRKTDLTEDEEKEDPPLIEGKKDLTPIPPQHEEKYEVVKPTWSHPKKPVDQELPSPPAENSPLQTTDPQGLNRPEHEQLASHTSEADDRTDIRPSPPHQLDDIQPPNAEGQAFEKPAPSGFRTAQATKPPSALSRETTSTTVISVMPSAQVAPTVQAPAPNESLPSTGDKLSEQEHNHTNHGEEASSYLSTQAAIAAANLQLQKELTTPQTVQVSAIKTLNTDPSTRKPKSKSGITPFSAFNVPNHRMSSTHDFASSLNTQEMLNAVSPFDLTTTVKKVPPPSNLLHQDSTSPTTNGSVARKPVTRSQKQKRASFAPPPDTASTSGSSQGSIKASLRVSKPNGVDKTKRFDEERAKGGPASGSGPSLFGKYGLDMETSPSDDDDENEAHNPSRDVDIERLGQTSTQGRSRSTNNFSSSKPDAQKFSTPRPILSNSNHSHDRIHVSKQNNFITNNHEDLGDITSHNRPDGDEVGNDHEDKARERERERETAFDLSAAMDEVGTFLQSWDVERDASNIKHASQQGQRRSLRSSGRRR